MAQVSSNWKITLDPDGEALVLVDFAQRMNDEITMPWKQVVDQVQKPGAEGMTHFPRGNVSGGLAIASYKDHADDATAREWMAALFAALTDFSNAATTLKVEIQGGDIYTVSNVVLEEAPTRMVETAPVARTITQWKLRTGTWALSGSGGPDPVGLDGALMNFAGSTGTLDAGGAAADHLEAVATWQNSGAGAVLANATAGQRPVLLSGPGLYLPGTAGNYAKLPDTAAIEMTSEWAIYINVALPTYRPAAAVCLASKWTEAGDQRSWRLMLNANGTVTVEISTAGTAVSVTSHTSTVALPLGSWEPLRLSMSRSATQCYFTLWSEDLSAGVLLGDILTGLATLTPVNATAPLNLGATEAGTEDLLTGVVREFRWWRTTAVITFASADGIIYLDRDDLSYANQVPYIGGPLLGLASVERSGTNSARMVFAPVLRYDGTDDSLALATPAALNAVSGATLAWMGTLNTVAGTQDLVFCANNSTGIRLLLRANGAMIELHVRRLDGEAVAVISYAAALTAYLPKVVIAVVDYASGIATIYLDGTVKASGTLTSAGVTSATDSTETRVMAGQAGANPARGEVNAVLLLDEVTPFDEVADLYTTILEASR